MTELIGRKIISGIPSQYFIIAFEITKTVTDNEETIKIIVLSLVDLSGNRMHS